MNISAKTEASDVQSCQTCHFNTDMLNDASFLSNPVHIEDSRNHKATLVNWESFHTVEEAMAHNVDMVRLRAYISSL